MVEGTAAAITLKDLFDVHDPNNGRDGSSDQQKALFECAYCDDDGPFKKVIGRLANGFSVLVYLPGNCMASAAAVTQDRAKGWAWTEYGQHPDENQSIADVWRKTGTITARLKSWITGARPAAIFHNLDFLSDGRGGVYPDTAAQTAIACLSGGARSGVVLGLSDRDAGPLPEPIARHFNEQVRIDEIPFEVFHRIMPRELGECLATGGRVPAGAVWLIAARLRWTDPIRAFRIMQSVARGHTNLQGILDAILNATQTVNFESGVASGGASTESLDDLLLARLVNFRAGEPTIFPSTVLKTLKDNIIRPFELWKHFDGSREECVRALARLPPGLILHGPPGTGKTLLARWIARSIGLPLRIISGAEIRAGLWGDAEKNVRNLFRDARRAAPCVLVLDDADDLVPDRDCVSGGVASAERAVVNEFLQQLQGMRGRLEGVLVILTTNRFETIDRAAKERLAQQVRVPYPLDRAQLGEIVDAVADLYGFEIADVRNALLDRFERPVRPGVPPPPDRNLAVENLFSPREIQTAMRLLQGPEAVLGGRYRPTDADLERLQAYYQAGTPSSAGASAL
jgi:hypothetical protein